MSDPTAPVVAHVASWRDYLPAVLQEPQLYWIGAVNLAVVGIFQSFPLKYRAEWMIQLGTFLVSLIFSFWLIGFSVYAFGISLIASWGATSFYGLAFSSLTSYIRRVLGQSTPAEPLQYPPASTTTIPKNP